MKLERPLLPAQAIVQRAADALATRAHGVRLVDYQDLVTHEGEDAALATLHGRRGDAVTSLTLGIVFGDDFYVELLSDGREDARRRVRETRLGLPAERVRPYRFASPAGWRRLTRSRVTELHSPDGHAVISVFPALPLRAAPTAPARATHFTAGGVEGIIVVGADHEVVELRDGRFSYRARLDCGAPHIHAHRRPFEQLVYSIEVLPRSSAVHGAVASACQFWAQ